MNITFWRCRKHVLNITHLISGADVIFPLNEKTSEGFSSRIQSALPHRKLDEPQPFHGRRRLHLTRLFALVPEFNSSPPTFVKGQLQQTPPKHTHTHTERLLSRNSLGMQLTPPPPSLSTVSPPRTVSLSCRAETSVLTRAAAPGCNRGPGYQGMTQNWQPRLLGLAQTPVVAEWRSYRRPSVPLSVTRTNPEINTRILKFAERPGRARTGPSSPGPFSGKKRKKEERL